MRLRLSLLAASALLSVPLHAQTPQTVFYGAVSTSEKNQIQAWGSAYWTKVEAGTPTASWTFTNAAMNSPLFNPFRGSRQTLENVGLIGANDCDKAIVEYGASGDSATQAKRQAIKDALLSSTIKTDPVTDPQGYTNHALKVLNASVTAEFVAYSEGGKLVTEKLPLDVLTASGASPEFATSLSSSTINAINATVVVAPGYALNASGVSEAQKLISGAPSTTDDVESKLSQMLSDLGVTGARVSQMEAAFGVYGSLPICIVMFNDAMILVDAVNGSVSGPYKTTSDIDARGLLVTHSEYAAGTGVRNYTKTFGCVAVAGPVWVPGAPPTIPTFPAPGPTPSTPASPTPGGPAAWTCGPVAPGVCQCDRIEVWVWPGKPIPNRFVRVLRRCTFAPGVAGCPPVPAWLPGTTPPAGTLAPTCWIVEHEVW